MALFRFIQVMGRPWRVQWWVLAAAKQLQITPSGILLVRFIPQLFSAPAPPPISMYVAQLSTIVTVACSPILHLGNSANLTSEKAALVQMQASHVFAQGAHFFAVRNSLRAHVYPH